MIKTDKKIDFIKKCEYILQLTEKIKGDLNTVRIIITEKRIPDNYYIWGHFSGKKSWKGPYEPDKFWILSPTALTNILGPGVLPIQPTLLRMVQRAAVISVVGQLNHDETYGCLFDTTKWLRDGQYFVRNAFICEECRSRILRAESVPEGHHVAFLNEVQKWIFDSMQTPKLLPEFI